MMNQNQYQSPSPNPSPQNQREVVRKKNDRPIVWNLDLNIKELAVTFYMRPFTVEEKDKRIEIPALKSFLYIQRDVDYATRQLMDKSDYFTLCFFDGDKKDALKICGSKSGRDCDKIKEAGLTPKKVGDGAYTFEEAVAIAQANLDYEGKGHSVSLHTNDIGHARFAGQKLEVARILVNQICSTMNGGALTNSLTPTTTLGCCSWGNNSISENFSHKFLLNVIRVAYPKKDTRIPTDDEIWG